MNPAEYTALRSPQLSHPARSLYTLWLQPLGLQGQPLVVDYPTWGRQLAVQDSTAPNGFSYQITATGLTAVLQELAAIGLVELPPLTGKHYHGAVITLPLQQGVTGAALTDAPYRMHLQWQPGPALAGLAALCGLHDVRYEQSVLGEFIAYWMGRPTTVGTSHHWLLKFIRYLKSQRYAKATPTVGYQTVTTPEPAASPPQASARAKELREAYARIQQQGQV